MNIPSFTNKRVTILGLGVLGGGSGSAAFFAKRGAYVHIADLRSKQELQDSLSKLSIFSNITYSFGEHSESDIERADLIVPNPGVPREAPILQVAKSKSIHIEMAESLFLKWFGTDHVIGVTGTRGKSTTSMMIYEALKNTGHNVLLGGNMKGVSTLSLLDEAREDSYVVLELSSWQLAGLEVSKLSPHIAVLTNIYPDHLNRYQSINAYIEDKLNIARYQSKDDICIVNGESDELVQRTSAFRSTKILFRRSDWPNIELAISGEHNRENASAALVVAKAINLDEKPVIEAISSYNGLPGRLEKIAEIEGVTYINDTTSTTPIAGVVALSSFQHKNVILIAGGNTKGIPMDNYVNAIKKHTKAVIIFDGTAKDAFMEVITQDNVVPLKDIETAVVKASSLAKSGDIVLFSPGVTHLPQINEFRRGDLFNHAVETIKNKTEKAH